MLLQMLSVQTEYGQPGGTELVEVFHGDEGRRRVWRALQ
jgi:hypothetical protein